MLSVLITSAAIGLGAAALVLTIPRLTGRRQGRWVAPATGGLSMLVFMLWAEYSWYARAVAELPEGSVVAEELAHQSPLQPWTLLAPRVYGFAALGPATTIRGTDLDLSIAAVVVVERFARPRSALQLFDCAAGRRAGLAEPPAGEALRLPAEPRWVAEGPDDPLIRAACPATAGG